MHEYCTRSEQKVGGGGKKGGGKNDFGRTVSSENTTPRTELLVAPGVRRNVRWAHREKSRVGGKNSKKKDIAARGGAYSARRKKIAKKIGQASISG